VSRAYPRLLDKAKSLVSNDVAYLPWVSSIRDEFDQTKRLFKNKRSSLFAPSVVIEIKVWFFTKIVNDKHSSLFVKLSNDEKKFYNTDLTKIFFEGT